VGGAASNYSPGNGDTAVFNSGTRACTVDQSVHLAELDIEQRWLGTLTVNVDMVADTIQQTSCCITVSGGATLTSCIYTLNSGWINGDGELDIENGFFTIEGEMPPVVNVATVNVDTASVLTIASPCTLGGQDITLEGTSFWEKGAITLGLSTEITSFNVFTVTCDSPLIGGIGTLFDNAGSFIKEGTVGTTDILTPFVNEGSGAAPVDVESGNLSFDGWTDSFWATATVQAGSTLLFTGPTVVANLGAGSAFSGNGAVVLDNGAYASVSAGVTEVFVPTLVVQGAATLDGPGAAISQTSFSFASGDINCNFTSYGNAVLWSNGVKTFGGGASLTNNGYLLFTDPGALTVSGTVVNNGTFELPNDANISALFFANNGTVTKTASPFGNWSTFNTSFINGGNLQLNGFTILFNSTLTQNAPSNFNGLQSQINLAGGTVRMIAGSDVLLNAGVLTGPGTIDGTLMTSTGSSVNVSSDASNQQLFVTGDFWQGPNSTLQVTIWANGMADALYVWGTANLAGDLSIILGPNYQPTRNDNSVMVLAAMGGINGFFDDVSSPWLATIFFNFMIDVGYFGS
jgi:hypothetical protein